MNELTIKWNDEPEDSPLVCVSINDEIKLWPNTLQIGIKGRLTYRHYHLINQCRPRDSRLRCYMRPVEIVGKSVFLFLNTYKFVFYKPELVNGWTRI